MPGIDQRQSFGAGALGVVIFDIAGDQAIGALSQGIGQQRHTAAATNRDLAHLPLQVSHQAQGRSPQLLPNLLGEGLQTQRLA